MRLLLLFLFLSLNCYGKTTAVQDSLGKSFQNLKLDTAPAPAPLAFEEEELASYRENPEFDYSETPQDTWWSRFKSYLKLQYQRFLQWLFGDYQTSSIIAFLIRLLPYLVLAGILFLFVWIFNRMNPASYILGNREEGKVFFSEEEEIIRSQDINALIEKAVAAEDYRLAIRYYFLLVLQRLSETGTIQYQSSKTDTEYHSELKDPRHQQQFKKLNRIYDYVWYGNFEVSYTHYQRSKKEMDLMLNLIQEHNE